MAMRRSGAIGAAVLLLGSAGCALLAGIDEPTLIQPEDEPSVPCSTLDDCVAKAPECRTAAACEEGLCVFDAMADGVPIAAQKQGDCVAVVCDGAGATKVTPIASDAFDDGNPCTLDACDGKTPVHTPQGEAPCYTGAAETKGVGACKAGTQQCDPQGNPAGGCVGEVTPEAERCEAAEADEDCDGKVNEEGEGCICGDGYLSTGEQCDDGNQTNGDSCAATCEKEQALPVAHNLHTCAILYNGTIKCWGHNSYGKLGLGHMDNKGDQPNEMGANLPVIDLGAGYAVKASGGGYVHTCVMMGYGGVRCWGGNEDGELGRGDTVNQGDTMATMVSALDDIDLGYFNGSYNEATAIAVGSFHSCALFTQGDIKCWGGNNAGQLGLGSVLTQGDQQGEMGDNLAFVSLGQKVTAITAGWIHTCALLADGSVKCWGSNEYGQLGLEDTNNRGDGADEMGDKLPAVNLGTGKTAKAVAAGTYHTCALLSDGSVKCWGRNEYGQLGVGDIDHRGDAPGEMGDNLPAVDLGAGKTAVAIDAGSHTCALLNDSSVKCWGFNEDGQLGLEDTNNRGDGADEMGDKLPAVNLGTGKTATAITTGSAHTCARLNDGTIKCWGWNGFGQLGLGVSGDRGDETGEMGDNLPTVKLFSDVW
jgi:cysteine-rich repeat protein